MSDPHVQPGGDQLRLQEVAHPAQETAHEKGTNSPQGLANCNWLRQTHPVN